MSPPPKNKQTNKQQNKKLGLLATIAFKIVNQSKYALGGL